MDQAERLRTIIKMNRQDNSQKKIQNQDHLKPAKVIAVTSGKGGVGKSNVSINLAIQLTKLQHRVVIFDADFGLANIEVMFGAVPKYNFSDLIYGGKGIRDIITQGPMGIGFISGGSGIPGMGNLTKPQIEYLAGCLCELDEIADIIIIDTGAGISDSVVSFLTACAEILLVVTPEPTSVTDAYSLLKILNRTPGFGNENTSIRVVTNRVGSEHEGAVLYSKLNAVVKRFLDIRIGFLGYVPEDRNISRAVIQQTPISIQNPWAKSSKAFERMASVFAESTRNQPQQQGFVQIIAGLMNRKM